MSETWITRADPELTRPYGVEELHQVCFEPVGWPGRGTTISLGIPECELQHVFIRSDGELVISINRPRRNKNVKGWTRTVCEMATEQRALVFFSCDTAEQAAIAAKRAAKWLPCHQRAAIERVFNDSPAFRTRSNLS
jgi:hypothetical protein